MNKNNFIKWLEENKNISSYSSKRYISAIDTISSEIERFGLNIINLYNIYNIEIIDNILSNPLFQEKNQKGNRMYSAALNHYKKFLEESNRDGLHKEDDGSDLLGYVDIKGDFKEGPLSKAIRVANEQPHLPYFILLDEMNLARVEYYFSDILSVMESRRWEDGKVVSSTLSPEGRKGRGHTP
ncbi:hypothetical protein DFO73_101562 [Cytobacillus oceanisediminis]|uniref:Uncharacterized protein n=1 Tax=Cytobacillus oceanisediminis TaxID=665099 RepID=A0A2V3A6S9_9BACI|nr:hypothetical protein [Cytobacillus oceanisediminis]PWW32298.1 hypothetical protein DFO73_101562 [Cytobacillus oceanisediminis]